MTTQTKEPGRAVAAGEPDSPNEALANLVVDELISGGLIRPADRRRLLEGLVAGKVEGSEWKLLFENQLETPRGSDASK